MPIWEVSCSRLREGGFEIQVDKENARFVNDPDGYRVMLLERTQPQNSQLSELCMAQTMFRVKDANISVPFYEKMLHMTVVQIVKSEKTWDYLLATLPTELKKNMPAPDSAEAETFVKNTIYAGNTPVLVLRWVLGTEQDTEFKYFEGNELGRQGFGHIGFLVDDWEGMCTQLEETEVPDELRPDFGKQKGIRMFRDPDGYMLEIMKRGSDETFIIRGPQ